MKTTFSKLAVLAVLTSALAACAQPETPEDRYYRLQVSTPAQSGVVLPGNLQVDRFLVDGLVSRSQIVYVANGQGHELQTYHYHHWTEPPAILLQDQLIGYLRAAKIADHVVSPEMRVDVDHVLTGKVKRLEHIAGKTPKAVVELEVSVRRVRDGALVYLASERAEQAATDATVSAGVVAMNSALSNLFAKVTAGLKAAK